MICSSEQKFKKKTLHHKKLVSSERDAEKTLVNKKD